MAVAMTNQTSTGMDDARIAGVGLPVLRFAACSTSQEACGPLDTCNRKLILFSHPVFLYSTTL
jgi:hypothetical protein